MISVSTDRTAGSAKARAAAGEPLRFIIEVAFRHTGDECLTWPFGRNSWGYGKLKVAGKYVGAHRYVCKLVHGAPPTADHDAAHSCGKGHDGCIAPEHLSWKTRAENKDDELVHGTRNRGERNGQVKLTEADVREILALKGMETKRETAARFGVVPQTISYIHTGRNWAWLSEESAA